MKEGTEAQTLIFLNIEDANYGHRRHSVLAYKAPETQQRHFFKLTD